ncbi:MAG: UPF0182 family protein [Anaerolineae bacterium]
MRLPPMDAGPNERAPRRRGRQLPPLGGVAFLILLGVLFVVFMFGYNLISLYTDGLWFQSLGYFDVFATEVKARIGLFVLGFVLSALFLGGNWMLARWLVRREPLFFGQENWLDGRAAPWIITLSALVLSLFMALNMADNWDTLLLYQNQQTFGRADPIFNLDIGYYVFGYPFLRFVQGWVMALLFLALVGVIAVYLIARRPQLQARIYRIPDYMRIHISILGALIALDWGFGYWLDRYDILYSPRGVVWGAGYTDIVANLRAYNLLAGVMVLIAVLILAWGFTDRWWLPAIGAVIWVVVAIGFRGVYPSIVQNYQVRPNEFSLEQPYIVNHIQGTRRAYDIDNVQTREFTPKPLTTQDFVQNASTVRNIRLWDYRPLKTTYAQLQEIRSYYDFVDVDVDRYKIGNTSEDLHQVTISARELSSSQLPNRTWVNQHLEFTHGYGAVMSPVNEVTPQGYPYFFIQNIPPTSTVQVAITNPAIYFGEATDSYVFVKTTQAEFDYPVGDQNAQTTYSGTGGVVLDSFLKKLAFALRFGDTQILFTDAFTPESRILFNRLIDDRAQTIAPFLQYDSDPYMVVDDGRLWWIQDAYTTTEFYPYSKPFQLDRKERNYPPLGPLNYIRNSVKVVTDAYNGTVTYYVADPNDPIIKAWQGIFPTLLKPISEMPASLRAHVRYPEDMFNLQAQVYGDFHVTDPRVFYNREDPWVIPQEVVGTQRTPVMPYYVVMKLQGEPQAEFLLIQPFTPSRKDNMIGWMAARSDGDAYGQLVAYNFPKQENIQGPLQVEARIDQDPTISAQLTLWNQRGSSVIRGNLLVIPMNDSLLYVEPLYLQGETGQVPQLQRVVLVSQDRTPVMRETLAQALEAWNAQGVLASGAPPAAPPSGVAAAPVGTPAGGGAAAPPSRTAADVAQSAQAHYQAAQTAIKAGDWTTYGRELDALQTDLQELVRLTGGVPAGTPSPGGTPAAGAPAATATPVRR